MGRLLINRPTSASRQAALEAAAPYRSNLVEEVREQLRLCPRFGATPCIELPGIARELGVGAVGRRMKEDGWASTASRPLAAQPRFSKLRRDWRRHSLEDVPAEALVRGECRLYPRPIFTAATAGNHGRSVAAGAALVRGDSIIFVPDGIPKGQVAAIKQLGALIIPVSGTYDDALLVCREAARDDGWFVVADCAEQEDEDVPARVQLGYCVIRASRGTGSRALTICSRRPASGDWLQPLRLINSNASATPPRSVIVEPEAACCLFESATAGAPTRVQHSRSTSMGRLECFAPSLSVAIFDGFAHAFLTLEEEEADEAAARLDSFGFATSTSGAAGFAGLVAVARRPEWRKELELDGNEQGNRHHHRGAPLIEPASLIYAPAILPPGEPRLRVRSEAVVPADGALKDVMRLMAEALAAFRSHHGMGTRPRFASARHRQANYCPRSRCWPVLHDQSGRRMEESRSSSSSGTIACARHRSRCAFCAHNWLTVKFTDERGSTECLEKCGDSSRSSFSTSSITWTAYFSSTGCFRIGGWLRARLGELRSLVGTGLL